MLKQYNNTNDTEKYILREYRSWATSDCPQELKAIECDRLKDRAIALNIQHLL